MIDYLIIWGHMYLIHVSAWTSLIMLNEIYQNGVPKPIKALKLLARSAFVAAVLGLFSSHAHSHYLSHFVGGK
jgi:hypothetical protein